MTDRRKVVMSGMRPTGRLHIGNYWGALRNWVELQDRYDCYFALVDWHMLTTGYGDTSALREDAREMLLDWLAAGLDPERCVIFRQSDVPEHAELALLLGMVTPLSWLENNPTWKEQLQELARTKHARLVTETAASVAVTAQLPPTENSSPRRGDEFPSPSPTGRATIPSEGDPSSHGFAKMPNQEEAKESLRTFGFLGYPVLQAADILLYDGELVPVGQDQLPHLELSREIARRLNSLYGRVVTEPQPLLTSTPKVPGTDGRKMSKSYGNAIEMLEAPEPLRSKAMAMYTDPTKLRAGDKGHPEPCAENPPGCAVFALHKLYSPHAARREAECRGGEIGCVACKKDLLASMEGPFGRFREARLRLAADPKAVEDVLARGGRRARETAARTMERVRRAMRLR